METGNPLSRSRGRSVLLLFFDYADELSGGGVNRDLLVDVFGRGDEDDFIRHQMNGAGGCGRGGGGGAPCANEENAKDEDHPKQDTYRSRDKNVNKCLVRGTFPRHTDAATKDKRERTAFPRSKLVQRTVETVREPSNRSQRFAFHSDEDATHLSWWAWPL